jgi:hypothetical protein
VFPLRAVAFFAMYLILNTIFYSRKRYAHDYILEKTKNSIDVNPALPPETYAKLEEHLGNYRNNAGDIKYPPYTSYVKKILAWAIVGDVFVVWLFIAMILGLLLTHADTSMFIGFLHFIGVVLMTHMAVKNASADFLIAGVVIGAIVPALIEVWNLLQLYVFKSDFYSGRE